MSGDFSGFSVEAALLLIGLQARTGELVIESGNNIGSVYFHEGSILQASSPYSRAIGDLLVEDGVITDAELLDVLKIQKMDSARPIGSLLLATGKVGFEAVEMMVHEQIRKAMSDFSGWRRVTFSFVERNIKPYDTINLPVHEFIDDAELQRLRDQLARMLQSKEKSRAQR